MFFCREAKLKMCHSMNATGKLKIAGTTYDFTSDDLQDLGEIGKIKFELYSNLLTFILYLRARWVWNSK